MTAALYSLPANALRGLVSVRKGFFAATGPGTKNPFFRNRNLEGRGIHTDVSGCRRARVEEFEDVLEERSVISIERRQVFFRIGRVVPAVYLAAIYLRRSPEPSEPKSTHSERYGKSPPDFARDSKGSNALFAAKEGGNLSHSE